MQALHDVGSLLHLWNLAFLQESAMTSGFVNCSCQEIENIFGFIDETSHLELVL
jgi:hypothetical protein